MLKILVVLIMVAMFGNNKTTEMRTEEIQTTNHKISGARFSDGSELVYREDLKSGRTFEVYNGDVEVLYLQDDFEHPIKVTHVDSNVIFIDGEYYDLDNLETDEDADEIVAAINHWR